MRWGGVGMITFFELAHMVGATQQHVPCTCTHGRCYATACSLHLHTWSVLRKSWDGVGLGWGGVGMVTFIELAHMVGATQQHVPCTCTHGRCYASHGMGWGWGGVGWAWLCSLNLHRKYHVPVSGIFCRSGFGHFASLPGRVDVGSYANTWLDVPIKQRRGSLTGMIGFEYSFHMISTLDWHPR